MDFTITMRSTRVRAPSLALLCVPTRTTYVPSTHSIYARRQRACGRFQPRPKGFEPLAPFEGLWRSLVRTLARERPA